VLVLLDYDDTLLPSTWVIEETEKEVNAMRLERVKTELERRRHLSKNDQQQDAFCKVVESATEHLRQLETAAIAFLSQLLHAEGGCRRTDVKIVIVSNGDTAWVTSSMHGLLPGLEQFLGTMQIEMISARAKFSAIYPNNPQQWKVCCFADEMRKAKIHFEALLQAEAGERNKEALARLCAAQVMQSSHKDGVTDGANGESIASTPTQPPSSITENSNDMALDYLSQETWDADDNDSYATGMVPAKHMTAAKSEAKNIREEKRLRVDPHYADEKEARLVIPYAIPLDMTPNRCCPEIVPVPAVKHQQEVLSQQHLPQYISHAAPADVRVTMIKARQAAVDSKEVSDDDNDDDDLLCDKENTQQSLKLGRRSRSPSFDSDADGRSRNPAGVDMQEAPALDLLVLSVGDGQHERAAVLLLGEHEPNIQVASLKLLDALPPAELVYELQYVCDNILSVIDLAWARPTQHEPDGAIFDPLDLMIVRSHVQDYPTPPMYQPYSLKASASPVPSAHDTSWAFDVVDYFDEEEEIFTSVPSMESGSLESNGDFCDLAKKGKVAEFAPSHGSHSVDYYSAVSADSSDSEVKRSTAHVSADGDSDTESAASKDDAGTSCTESSEDLEADAKDYFRFNQKSGFGESSVREK